ncbi:MAG TPA: hypothetical protein VFU38_01955 [Candidatus Krumholzibacteria bacterium]|nr:hypothetical protein [Candidatus Krumholzibacteria bacterium]
MIVEEVVLMVAVTALTAWILWLVFRRFQVQTNARAQRTETFNRLIDKFGTAKEFVDFIQSDAGRKVLEDPIAPPADPKTSVRRFVASGIILLAVGKALLLNALRLRGQTDINFVREAMGMNYWGTIFVGGGAALILVGIVSYFMAKRWN